MPGLLDVVRRGISRTTGTAGGADSAALCLVGKPVLLWSVVEQDGQSQDLRRFGPCCQDFSQ